MAAFLFAIKKTQIQNAAWLQIPLAVHDRCEARAIGGSLGMPFAGAAHDFALFHIVFRDSRRA